MQANFNNNEIVSEYGDFYIYETNKSYKIYKDGRIEESKLLPDEYQQVEYIESTGTQWIDTKLLATNYPNMNIEIKGSFTTILNTSQYIFGANKSRWTVYIIRSF